MGKSCESKLHTLFMFVTLSIMFYVEIEYHSNIGLGPRPLGPKEIDGLLVPPGKAYTLLTNHLSLPRKNGSSQTIHMYIKPFVA